MDIAIASSPVPIHADAATPIASTSGYPPPGPGPGPGPGYQQPLQHARPHIPSSPLVSAHAHAYPHQQQYQLQQQQQYPQPYAQPQGQPHTQAQAQPQNQAQIHHQQHQYYLAQQQLQAQRQLQTQHQQQLQQHQLQQLQQQQQLQHQQQQNLPNGHTAPPQTRGRGRGRGRGSRGGATGGGGRGGAAAAASATHAGVADRQATPPFVYLQRPSNAGLVGGAGGTALVNGNMSGGSPSSTDSESLPSNHIHIVQTTPTAQLQRAHPYPQPHGYGHAHAHGPGGMLRSNSILSTTSVPPALTHSNGPSPNEDTSNPPSTDNEYYTTPPKQILPSNHHQQPQYQYQQQNQNQASPLASGTTTAPGTGPRVSSGYPSSSSVETFPHSAQTQASTLVQPVDMVVGAGQDAYTYITEDAVDLHQLLSQWSDGFEAMRGGTHDEWVEFVNEHFVQDARFSLGFVGEEMRIYDIPVFLLPRVLAIISENAKVASGDVPNKTVSGSTPFVNHMHVHRPTTTTSNHAKATDGSAQDGQRKQSGVEDENDTESFDLSWYYGRYIWKGSISAEVVEDPFSIPILMPTQGSSGAGGGGGGGEIRFGRMEMLVMLNEGDKVPEGIIRVLEISETMEHLSTVMEIHRTENILPKDALQKLIGNDSRPSTAMTYTNTQPHEVTRENGDKNGQSRNASNGNNDGGVGEVANANDKASPAPKQNVDAEMNGPKHEQGP